jgi:hypothetical protein
LKTACFFTYGSLGAYLLRGIPPRGMSGFRVCRALAPTGPMLKLEYGRYREMYFRDILGRLDPKVVSCRTPTRACIAVLRASAPKRKELVSSHDGGGVVRAVTTDGSWPLRIGVTGQVSFADNLGIAAGECTFYVSLFDTAGRRSPGGRRS